MDGGLALSKSVCMKVAHHIPKVNEGNNHIMQKVRCMELADNLHIGCP